MALIHLRNLTHSYGDAPLLDDASLVLEPKEKVCLLGRNGTGKSTLMRIIAGEIKPDEGERVVRQHLRIARLDQEVPLDLTGTTFEVTSSGLGELTTLMQRYHRASAELTQHKNEAQMRELTQIQQELERVDGWQIEQRVETVLSKLSLDPEKRFETLSGGLKRRVLLAKALVLQPDLLLLDEPTNHLDIDSIDWLEEVLAQHSGTVLFVTHDRQFLRRLATRIVELDRGQLFDYPGDYEAYLKRQEQRLEAEAGDRARFDKKLASEERWIRQGIKARRTRNEGRVRALKRMRKKRQQRREQAGKGRILFQDAASSSKRVIEAEALSFAWEGEPIVRDFSCAILRGDRVGVIGPNGVGKSTLLSLLLGKLNADSGQLRLGERLKIAYFDQLRDALDPEATVRDSVLDGADQIAIGGGSKHVIGYLQDFLFSPKRAQQPVSALSGGEKNRLLLARLFCRPFNLLVMDEPTNDLDIETLELLEERLMEYQGTLLLVSHDRAFLDNVVTSTFVFEGDGVVNEYVGGYQDWLRQRADAPTPPPKTQKKESKPDKVKNTTKGSKKLGFMEQRELTQLPQKIEKLEAEVETTQTQLSDPALYREEGTKVAALKVQLTELESALSSAYQRWEELESKTK